MAKKKKNAKKPSTKTITQKVWSGSHWNVHYGHLKRNRGRPARVARLFTYVGEKLPFEALDEVQSHFVSDGTAAEGVYIAHDSVGSPRYIGRGNVFTRLRTHKKAHPHELVYFSIYVVEDKQHEREIETLLIRSAGDQLMFNNRKKRVGIKPGDIRDYEPGTVFYERQSKKGHRAAVKRAKT